MMRFTAGLLIVASAASAAHGQTRSVIQPFHWHDDYTEYHLLAPDTHQFRIVYYLNQRQAGLTYLLNQTRAGSEGSGISVTDPRNGKPLKFDYMTGAELTAAGVPGRLAAGEHYIRAILARPVPEGGEGRTRIEKTYRDEASYVSENKGAAIVFARSLGIGRNAIILPEGYALASTNVAADIATLADGRIRLAFENGNGYAADVSIRATRRAGSVRRDLATGGGTNASDFTKTLYELRTDGTIAFRHEFVKWTEGDRVTFPPFFVTGDAAAIDMDTGRALTLIDKGAQAPGEALIDAEGGPVQSTHVGVSGTMRDPGYLVSGGTLSWSRPLLEPRATVVLPAGFEIVSSATPVTSGTLPDGRVYLQFVNKRLSSVLRLDIRAAR